MEHDTIHKRRNMLWFFKLAWRKYNGALILYAQAQPILM